MSYNKSSQVYLLEIVKLDKKQNQKRKVDAIG